MIAVTAKTQTASESDSPAIDEFPTQESILGELERIQASKHFRSSTRGKQFLTYVVQNALEKRTEMLKERVIGSELFGKPADYATGEEPVVRVQAGEVRRRLHDYYLSGPTEARVLIELPMDRTCRFSDGSPKLSSPPRLDSTATKYSDPPEPVYDPEEQPNGRGGRPLRNLLPWSFAVLGFGIAIICALFAFSPSLFRTRTEID